MELIEAFLVKVICEAIKAKLGAILEANEKNQRADITANLIKENSH